MTACSACGDCCDPVWYPWGAADIRQAGTRATPGADLAFAAEHWHATGERRGDLHAYRCDRFDPATRLCTAHDDR
ncbi:MAG: YkgJ family cysteine cluster protein, partial [Frankiales bacterium]|nr:YkgJ family cysteine cluster protein [Frankiales bacterium]